MSNPKSYRLESEFELIRADILAQYNTTKLYWLLANGKDCCIVVPKYGRKWFERATIADFRRVVVY